MNKFFKYGLSILILITAVSCSKYKYETFENDPTGLRLYTLDNGLKVYMSVNNDEPRIDAQIAVRVGGKNDPSETTGLAHYFEHLMFKGTPHFGTQNYEIEKPMLDEIEALFETYRQTKDESERAAIYHKIDSVSYEASKIAIPNEYDKLMAAIGANGTNAYTANDQTVYVENIPSNQVENWAKIQSDRFMNPVIRGFHTELETIYEEKNMSLTNDGRKAIESLFSALFVNHPYGTQTVLGTQEHLKNPSITNVRNYHKEWYVPNNMAICLSGDFNPDEAIVIIDKYFGVMKPNNNLKKLSFKEEPAITEPIVKDVYGLEAANVMMGWRLPGANSKDAGLMNIVTSILTNGKTGLIDLNVNQRQTIYGGWAGMYGLTDYSIMLVGGMPKAGQSLDEVREILLAEVEKLKKGEFDESMLAAIVNNAKKDRIRELAGNSGRVNAFVNSFVNRVEWKDEIKAVEEMSKVTKEEVVAFANKYLQNNYAVIRKFEGKPQETAKISKPKITPIFMNRDTSSVFLRDVQNAEVNPIEPLFVDFNKDMSIIKAKSDIEVLYKENVTNELFSMVLYFDFGSNENLKLDLASNYLQYLGTDKKSIEQIQTELYALACDANFVVSKENTYLTIRGLSENMLEALELTENWLLNVVPAEPAVLEAVVSDILLTRENNKLDQGTNFSKLRSYALYGEHSASTNMLSEKELKALTAEELVSEIRGVLAKQHRILYYGPMTSSEFVAVLDKYHQVPEKLEAVKKNDSFKMQTVTEDKVIIAPYDAQQIQMMSLSNQGKKYDLESYPVIELYNNYFGGGMNSIVFQEMREARALAYSAAAAVSVPTNLLTDEVFLTFIATQNDKMIDALVAFDEIVENMPISPKAFDIAKESLLSQYRTSRVTKSNVLWRYLNDEKLGLTNDPDEFIFNKLQTLTLDDVIKYQKENIKDRKYVTIVLGREKDLDMKNLKKYGKIERVSTSKIFGY